MTTIFVHALFRARDRATARTEPSRNSATREESTSNIESADQIGHRRLTDG